MNKCLSSLILLIAFFQSLTYGDVFDQEDQHKQLNEAIKNDARLFYNKKSADFNIDAPEVRVKKITEDSISPGLKQFDIKKTITSQLDHPDLSIVEFNDVLRRIGNTRLMTMQYTAPAQMDLYKFYVTNANLRLILRYLQYLDIENHTQDPLMVLRKQAEMDCLRRQSTNIEIDQAFKNCVNGGVNSDRVFGTLNNPERGNGYLSGQVDLIKSSMLRSANVNDAWDDIHVIMPIYDLSVNKIIYSSAKMDARRYFSDRRRENIGVLKESLSEYLERRQLSEESLMINERMIRQITVLNEPERDLAMVKLASAHAYLETKQVFIKASSWLERSIYNPQIEGGVKQYLRQGLTEIENNWDVFDGEFQANQAKQYQLNQLIEQIEDRKNEIKSHE